MSKKRRVEDIDYEMAAEYLHNVKDQLLKNFFNIYTGGTFDSKGIKSWMKKGENGKPFSGLMFWNCFQDLDFGKRFTIVMEPKFGFDYIAELNKNPDVKSWRPQSSNLFSPGQEFGENIYGLTLDQKLNRLRTHKLKKVKVDQIPQFDVIDAIDLFLNESILKKINASPFSYFNREDLSRDFPPRRIDFYNLFFGQGRFKHVRYYFGMDTGDEPYNLRMILVPTFESGQNMVRYKLGKVDKFLDNTILLQKSWPPPPNS